MKKIFSYFDAFTIGVFVGLVLVIFSIFVPMNRVLMGPGYIEPLNEDLIHSESEFEPFYSASVGVIATGNFYQFLINYPRFKTFKFNQK